ncbi:LLM class flavin-dependent oxidoreductase [Mycobacterium sp. KBS0706]|uniref:LLM class flavin-dependent oxidoreductase n=1 Tax=Mycobacterium sp. KBS0706 TaxID=2578109 RepID=UPI001C8F7609|nr:LLM class flavin-dependent oxidoreductase [Mycobacterium sp. KBS0706]
MPLSVLDLAPIASGSQPGQAVRNSLDLARLTDRLGFTRYWVAEHHSIPGVASTAPEVLIGHVAQVTERIRVGSGGVMLPNHAPLRVVEAFKMLESLHPGRIDLGLGRAPGSDQLTALAMRRSQEAVVANDFPEQYAELRAFADGTFPADHAFRNVHAVPDDVPLPPVWMLGSSEFGARFAARIGCGFAFAHHFSPQYTMPAMHLYRANFQPSPAMRAPHSILTVSVYCAEDAAEAERLAAPHQLSWVRLRTNRPGLLPSPEEALSYPYTAEEKRVAENSRRNQIVGTPETVKAEIERLAGETAASEVMITSMIHDHAARLRSYELVAKAFGLPGAAAA